MDFLLFVIVLAICFCNFMYTRWAVNDLAELMDNKIKERKHE